MIFVLYHLQKILHNFVKDLPVNINECYTFPSQSTDSSDSIILDDVDKKTENNEDQKVYIKSPTTSSSTGQTSPIIWTRRSKLQMQVESSENVFRTQSTENHQGETEKSRKHKTNERKDEAVTIIAFNPEDTNCLQCFLIFIADNMNLLIETREIETNMDCDGGCLMVNDSMERLVTGFFNLVVDLNTLKVKTMTQFKTNFRILSRNVLNKTDGSYRFYCQVLNKFMDLKREQQNRVVRLLNEITDICLEGHVKEFEQEISKCKLGKRNLTLFLYETGAIHSIHAVLQAFHKMYISGVNILLALPIFLSSLEDEFRSAPNMHTNKSYHNFLNDICRKFIIQFFKQKNIVVLEITKEDVHSRNNGVRTKFHTSWT